MGHYIRTRAADWALCTCLSAAMASAVCSGFLLESGLAANPLALFAAAAVVQALLLLAAFRRLTVGIGIAAGAVCAAAVVLYMRARRPMEDETAHSLFWFLLIAAVTAVLVFLLGRTRPGAAALFLAGSIIQAGAHFLEFPAPLWSFLLFLAGALILFFYRTYTVSLLKAELGTVRIGPYMRQILLAGLAALAAAAGIYGGIVRPLNPPTQELRLIRTLRSMPELEVLGVSSTELVLDPALTSQKPPDRTELGGQQGEDREDGLTGQQPEPPQASSHTASGLGTALQQLSAIRYQGEAARRLWLLLLIPAAAAGLFLLRLAYKRRWQRWVQALPRQEAVFVYYQFFLSRLAKIGLKKPDAHTLREYAAHIAQQLQAFDAEDCSFGRLTAVYEKALYGRRPVTEGEYQAFERFYACFYRNLRREIGAGRYYLQVFRF